jgi:hypothetical protein
MRTIKFRGKQIDTGIKQVTYFVTITTMCNSLKYVEYHKCIPERLTTSEKKQAKKLINETFNP